MQKANSTLGCKRPGTGKTYLYQILLWMKACPTGTRAAAGVDGQDCAWPCHSQGHLVVREWNHICVLPHSVEACCLLAVYWFLANQISLPIVTQRPPFCFFINCLIHQRGLKRWQFRAGSFIELGGRLWLWQTNEGDGFCRDLDIPSLWITPISNMQTSLKGLIFRIKIKIISKIWGFLNYV